MQINDILKTRLIFWFLHPIIPYQCEDHLWNIDTVKCKFMSISAMRVKYSSFDIQGILKSV